MNLLSIDPGLRACGAANWSDGKLIWAGFVKNRNGTDWRSMVDAVLKTVPMFSDQLAIELPQVYIRTRSKGDPNDLIMLAGLVGAFVSRFETHKLYKPHEWKGQVDPDVMIERIKKRLTPEELAVVKLPAASLAHNLFDGIGVGLHNLGRL